MVLALPSVSRFVRSKWAAFFAATLGVAVFAVTAVSAYYVHRLSERRERLEFENRVNRTVDLIRGRLEMYISALRGTRGLIRASQEVTVDEFATYVSQLHLEQMYPGIQGIGYTVRIPKERLGDYLQHARDKIDPAFEIRPKDERAEYHSITFLYPQDRRNRVALGYDMYTEPVRRAAMDQAWDTGEPVASGKVTLVQEIDPEKQAGFLIYLPVFKGGEIPGTVEARRESLDGFVYSPFRADDLLSGMMGDDPFLNFSLYDGNKIQPESLLHMSPRAITSPAARQRPKFDAVRSLTIAGRPWTMSFNSRSNSSETLFNRPPFWIFTAGALSGLLICFAAWTRITSIERIAESEKQARSEMEHASRIKDEFLATLSHELRTPLNAILGWSQIVARRHEDRDQLKQALEIIQRNAKTQARLIEDLLDMNRILTGKLKIDSRPFDVLKAIDTAIETIMPAARAKELVVSKDIRIGGATVTGDPNRLQQVFWNLLANSVKFTPKGGVISVRVERHDSNIKVSVSDTGEGISAEFLPYLFDRFRQADSSITRRHGGLGLGLSIARYLVELHGGQIKGESPGLGQGSTFKVTLPAASAASESEEELEIKTPSSEKVLDGVKVLVVDDEEDSRSVVATILEEQGAQVVCASSSDEGLQVLRFFRPHIILSDLGMPERDGYHFIREVKKNAETAQIPAIALTALARPEDREKAIHGGYQVHLSKPVDPSALLTIVSRIIRDPKLTAGNPRS